MKYACIGAAIASVIGAHACHAQEGVDKARATTFDAQMFGGPLSRKTYACFVRRYDASHLAQHPKQKVSAMKLLVTAEDAPEDKTVNYSFRVWERNKPDDDASNDLVAGADDKIFRVDRSDLHECSELVTDRKELAALRHK
ncbi:hypothetical protein IVB22_24675 [Bradyrhizobium sp. 190]|uniref:hypothetical protein n=1 Tax=Bradyrhizobium sp. 190 TaxID=2782658 RepID=UPI001FF915FD|nr:hypothetical protein [Bradyrhizobium sp. 190]MCK1515690.1 hypothetical protein [Bradyrhizobium sp. 190]